MSGLPSTSELVVDSPTVVVDNVCKTYLIGRGTSEDFRKTTFLRARMRVDALKGVSFVAKAGDHWDYRVKWIW